MVPRTPSHPIRRSKSRTVPWFNQSTTGLWLLAAGNCAVTARADMIEAVEPPDWLMAGQEPLPEELSACGAAACRTCCHCPPQWYGRAEYLHWWTKGSHAPPLLATSPVGTPLQQAGVLGQEATTLLLGDQRLHTGDRPGARFGLGRWLDSGQNWGIEGEYWFLGRQQERFQASSADHPILARPFVDAVSGQEVATLVAFPGVRQGSFTMRSATDAQAAGLWLRRNVVQQGSCRVDWLAGYQFLQLEDHLRMDQQSISTQVVGGVMPLGTGFQITDRFSTRNDFHGGSLGLAMQSTLGGRWSWRGVARMALGNNRQRATIDGQTTIDVPDLDPVTLAGGVLALDSNRGQRQRDKLVYIPQVELGLDYALLPHLHLTAGYTFLYVSNVVRPGDQIDRQIDPGLLPPPVDPAATRPSFRFRDTDFWAQGVHLGLVWER